MASTSRPMHRLQDFPTAVQQEILRFRDQYGQTVRQRSDGASTAAGDAQHVLPHDQGWAIKKEGSDRATRVFPVKSEAVEAAREIAKNQATQLVVHRQDGTVQDVFDYGS